MKNNEFYNNLEKDRPGLKFIGSELPKKREKEVAQAGQLNHRKINLAQAFQNQKEKVFKKLRPSLGRAMSELALK